MLKDRCSLELKHRMFQISVLFTGGNVYCLKPGSRRMESLSSWQVGNSLHGRGTPCCTGAILLTYLLQSAIQTQECSSATQYLRVLFNVFELKWKAKSQRHTLKWLRIKYLGLVFEIKSHNQLRGCFLNRKRVVSAHCTLPHEPRQPPFCPRRDPISKHKHLEVRALVCAFQTTKHSVESMPFKMKYLRATILPT